MRAVFARRVGVVMTAVVSAALAFTQGCGAAPDAPPVLVEGTDYAFQFPKELKAGATKFQFVNRGKVPHEMALGQLHAGISADSLMAYMAAGRDPGDLAQVVGILIANPGATSIGTLSTNLEAGRTYLMICSFKDADSLPPHIAMGMQSSFVAK